MQALKLILNKVTQFTKKVSKRTTAKVLADLSVNLASGWIGVLLISPGVFGVASISEY